MMNQTWNKVPDLDNIDSKNTSYITFARNHSSISYQLEMRYKEDFLKAAREGNIDKIKKLHSVGIDIKDNNENSPLALAIMNGKLETTKYLISLGSNINQVNSQGQNPLLHALKNNSTEIIMEILSQPNLQINKISNNGESALKISIDNNQLDIVKILFKRGADFSNIDGKNTNALDYAKQKGNDKIKKYLKKKIYPNLAQKILISLKSLAEVKKSGQSEINKFNCN